MPIPITGGDDNGPAACVARFIQASTAGDEAAAREELHPDARALAEEGGMEAPPMTAADLGEAIPVEDGVHVPAVLHNGGEEQRFVFAVRPVDGGWGVDLMASMRATFGGDPMEMLGDAMKEAMQPMAQAMGAIGEAIGGALSGAFGGSDGAPSARRITSDEILPEGTVDLEGVVVEVQRLTWQRTVEREFGQGDDEARSSQELSLRCGFRLPEGWTTSACLGVEVEVLRGLDGEDLRPIDIDEGLGAETYSSWERERGEYGISFTLPVPAPTFTGLAEFSGRLRLRVEGGEVVEVLLGPFREIIGTEQRIAALDLPLRITRTDEGAIQVVGPYDSFERFSDMDVIDAAGEKISWGYSGHGDGETSTRVFDGEAGDDAGLRLRFAARAGLVVLPFTAGGVPIRFG